MSNSCIGKEKSTGASKMGKISGSAKNYEHPSDKAERLCRGGYAEGGAVNGQITGIGRPAVDMPTIPNSAPTKPMTATTEKPAWMENRIPK